MDSSLAISVNQISKLFYITKYGSNYRTLREAFRNALSFNAIKARKSKLWALQDISFTVKKQEKLAIIGLNGAGKSTLLKILSRVLLPTSGSAHIDGRIASLLEVGTGFHPDLSGKENVYLNGAILGMSRAEVRAVYDKIVDFSGVEQFINTPIKFYSNGMQARLGFAVAAHLNSEILIVDEVLSVGDHAFHQKCIAHMQDICKSGRTILFVSHNMHAVKELCDRAMVLSAGKIIHIGDTAEVVKEYLGAPATHLNSALSWTGDVGNEYFRIHALQIKHAGKENDIPRYLPLSLHVKYKICRAVSGLVFGIEVFNARNERIAMSICPDVNTFSAQSPGLYAVRLNFDFSLFSAGMYTVAFSSLASPKRYQLHSAPRLQICINDESSALNVLYDPSLGGMVCPPAWKWEHLS